jgi:hypothetical protein
LLVACDPQAVPRVMEEFKKRNFLQAREIGRLSAGAPKLTVT